jgi:hypothetical protein
VPIPVFHQIWIKQPNQLTGVALHLNCGLRSALAVHYQHYSPGPYSAPCHLQALLDPASGGAARIGIQIQDEQIAVGLLDEKLFSMERPRMGQGAERRNLDVAALLNLPALGGVASSRRVEGPPTCAENSGDVEGAASSNVAAG